MIDGMEGVILKKRCPEGEELEEVDINEYITKEEQYNIHIEAWFEATRIIAEKILKRIRTYYKLDDNSSIRVYAGDTLLIATYRDTPVYTDFVHPMLIEQTLEDNGQFNEALKREIGKRKKRQYLLQNSLALSRGKLLIYMTQLLIAENQDRGYVLEDVSEVCRNHIN